MARTSRSLREYLLLLFNQLNKLIRLPVLIPTAVFDLAGDRVCTQVEAQEGNLMQQGRLLHRELDWQNHFTATKLSPFFALPPNSTIILLPETPSKLLFGRRVGLSLFNLLIILSPNSTPEFHLQIHRTSCAPLEPASIAAIQRLEKR